MAIQNASLRNSLRAVYASGINRLTLLDGATVLGSVTVTLATGADGVVSVDPGVLTYSAAGTVDGALLDNTTPGAEISALTVGTIAAGTAQVRLSSMTAVIGETVDFTIVSLTVPGTF